MSNWRSNWRLGRMCTRSIGAVASLFWVSAAMASAGGVRLNDLQFVGTHNSYHIAPDRALLNKMDETGYAESPAWPASRLTAALDYTHDPLEVQLDAGIRVFELDVHDDPAGGRFSNPGFFKALSPGEVGRLTPVDPMGDLQKPGLKVFHAADTDVRSHCLRFARCLETIRAWSQANPGHLPIIVQIETKEGAKPPVANAYGPVGSLPFEDEAWARLHAEIEAVFPPAQLLRPAEVQGTYASVNAAVRARGWPAIDSLRGRIIFLLLDDPNKQDQYARYTASSVPPLLFVSRAENDPGTGWLIRPKPKAKKIKALVRQGFLVYTRADANREEGNLGKAERRQEAFQSGAQMVATDYPRPDPRFGSYAVRFPTGFVRCNPILTGNCRPELLYEAPKKRE